MKLAALLTGAEVKAASLVPRPEMMYAWPGVVASTPARRIAKSFLRLGSKSPMPETAEPTNSLGAAPVKAALALTGASSAPLTVTSSTYQPSKLFAVPLLRKSNWILTLALPTYGVRSKLALIQPEVGSLSRPG